MRVIQYKTMLNDKGLPELVKEKASNYDCIKLTEPELIATMMRRVYQLHKQTEEFMYEICFTSKMKPIGVFEISHGTINSTLASPREILQKALICGAANIVIVHNHPSGEYSPSREDKNFTSRLKEASKLMGVNLADSIIVSELGYYSFAANEWKAD